MILRSPRAAVALVAAVLALTVTGCSTSEPPTAKKTPDANAQTDVPVPEGTKLTAYGTELKFGETATVAYAPNQERKTVLQLSVLSATQGSISDLSAYTLEERTRQSTPYYVRVQVKNVGDGDVGQTPIPLYLVDNRTPKTLIGVSSFNNTFAKCPSDKLPTTFAPQATLTTCLVFLAPDHGTMAGVSYLGADDKGDPILWTGPVATPSKKAS